MLKFKNFARFIVLFCAMATLMLPVVTIYGFDLSQWEAIKETWFFVLFSIFVLLIGVVMVEVIWRAEK